jgi:hypothetical protein
MMRRSNRTLRFPHVQRKSRTLAGSLPKEQGEELKISAQMTLLIAAVFAILCYGVAITGFSSIGEMTDPVQVADAKGFAWFWAFLGTVAAALGAVSLWIVRTQPGGEDA